MKIHVIKDPKNIPDDLRDHIRQETINNTEKRTAAANKKDRFRRSRIGFWIAIIKNELRRIDDPLYSVGIHYIDGATGAGKTLLMNMIQRQLTSETGFFWSSVDEFYSKKVVNFDMFSMWKDGNTQFRLPVDLGDLGKCKGIIFDEINRLFNRRLNRTTAYNDVFIPHINWSVTHRHRGIPRVYYIGQDLGMQDTQLQMIVKYKHVVMSKKRYYFYFWKKELFLVKAPYRLAITNFYKDKNTDSFRTIGTIKIDVTIEDLTTYNTYGFASDDNDLPVYRMK